MMARSHALTGAAAWLALAPPVATATGTPLPAGALAAGTVVTAGAALLPDLDHPSSTIARALGPISHLIARGVAAAAGGHRQATHSLAACLSLGTILVALTHTSAARTAGIVTGLLCVGLALRALGPAQVRAGGPIDLTLLGWTAALTWIGVDQVDPAGIWLPAAVTLGALAHLAGDLLTPEGVPLLWPASQRHAIPLLPRTGGLTEHLAAAGLTVAVAWLGHARLTV